VTFPAGVTSVSFDVPITNDNIHEGNETFKLIIIRSSLPTRVSNVSPSEATVTIVDDDCKLFILYIIHSLYDQSL